MKRIILISILTSSLFVLCTLWYMYNDTWSHRIKKTDHIPVDQSTGSVIMKHMGDATSKAELGRSTWKLVHTMMARYPEEPTAEERTALSQFIYLLSRLYPCGECAEHFQVLLEQYPPQTSSRIAASQWACAIHNKVNERLGKSIFDCSAIDAKYPCGCES